MTHVPIFPAAVGDTDLVRISIMSYDSVESSGEAAPGTGLGCSPCWAKVAAHILHACAPAPAAAEAYVLALRGMRAVIIGGTQPIASSPPPLLAPPFSASLSPAHPNPIPPSDHLPAPAPPPCVPRLRLPPSGSHRDHGAQTGAVLYDPAKNEAIPLPNFALRSGPRKTIYHNPKDVTAAIVTCELPQPAVLRGLGRGRGDAAFCGVPRLQSGT